MREKSEPHDSSKNYGDSIAEAKVTEVVGILYKEHASLVFKVIRDLIKDSKKQVNELGK